MTIDRHFWWINPSGLRRQNFLSSACTVKVGLASSTGDDGQIFSLSKWPRFDGHCIHLLSYHCVFYTWPRLSMVFTIILLVILHILDQTIWRYLTIHSQILPVAFSIIESFKYHGRNVFLNCNSPDSWYFPTPIIECWIKINSNADEVGWAPSDRLGLWNQCCSTRIHQRNIKNSPKPQGQVQDVLTWRDNPCTPWSRADHPSKGGWCVIPWNYRYVYQKAVTRGSLELQNFTKPTFFSNWSDLNQTPTFVAEKFHSITMFSEGPFYQVVPPSDVNVGEHQPHQL